MSADILPGLIQKARNDANALRFHISETDDGWRLSIYEGEGWSTSEI